MQFEVKFKGVPYYVLMDDDETFNYFVEKFLEKKAISASESIGFTYMNQEIHPKTYTQSLSVLFNNADIVKLGTVLKNNTILAKHSIELSEKPSSSYTPASGHKRIRNYIRAKSPTKRIKIEKDKTKVGPAYIALKMMVS